MMVSCKICVLKGKWQFSEPWTINYGNRTEYNDIRKNTSHVVLMHLASKERNSISGFSLISGFYQLNLVVASLFYFPSFVPFSFLFD